VKLDEMHKITTRTQVDMKNRMDSQTLADQKRKELSVKLGKDNAHSPTVAKGTMIGSFLQTKQATFGGNSNSLHPEFVDEQAQRQVKYVDLNTLRKGLNYHGTNTDRLVRENQQIADEAEAIERELNPSKDTKKKIIKKTESTATDAGAGMPVVMEGKLAKKDVQNLPDDVDEIAKTVTGMNFKEQDLDVLIELSKSLKQKRLEMFPDPGQ